MNNFFTKKYGYFKKIKFSLLADNAVCNRKGVKRVEKKDL